MLCLVVRVVGEVEGSDTVSLGHSSLRKEIVRTTLAIAELRDEVRRDNRGRLLG